MTWSRRLRIRRVMAHIAREEARAQDARLMASIHQVRAAAWRKVLEELLDGTI